MITLKPLRGPVVVDLGDRFGLPKGQVWIKLRRLTSTELDEARRSAVQVIAKVGQGVAALADYGLDGEDTNGVRINPADGGQMARTARLVEVVEVCMRAVMDWGGFNLDPNSTEVAPLNRQTLAVLLLDDDLERRIVREIEAAARILVAEGNVSGSSRSGSLEPAPIALDPNTAATVQSSDPPAPKGAPDPAGASVPKSRTPRKRSKA